MTPQTGTGTTTTTTRLARIALALAAGAGCFLAARSSAADRDCRGAIEVTDAARLAEVLDPANAATYENRTICVRRGTYVVERTLVVPEGTDLIGEGVMTLDAEGHPKEIRADTRTTLAVAPTFLNGHLLVLRDGTSASGLTLQDFRAPAPPRRQGNLLVVGSQRPGDRVSASIGSCELNNLNSSGVNLDGPTGRGLLVITNNLAMSAAPGPDDGSRVSARLTGSVINSPFGGSGIFAINFASNSDVSLTLTGNTIGGGLDSNSGVSRPDGVSGSTLSVHSERNLYRWDAAPSPESVGVNIHGGSSAPFPVPGGSGVETNFNEYRMHSSRDEIRGFGIGLVAIGGERSDTFSFTFTPGTVNGNTTNLELQHTRFVGSVSSDLRLYGAVSPNPAYKPGDGNVLRAVIRHVTGTSAGNVYANSLVGGAPATTPELAGECNALEIVGSFESFLATNEGLSPPADTSVFTGGGKSRGCGR